MNFANLETILIVLFVALLASAVFRYLRLPLILGYLMAGIVIGPNVLGWISNSEIIKQLAEFGVVFLMFTVGLEFSLSKLWSLKSSVFVLGPLQVLLTSAITFVVGLELGLSPISAIVVGGIVAMSSTVIVVKQLSDQLELYTKHGLNTLGILIFQDLSVIPLMIFLASLPLLSQGKLIPTLLFVFVKAIAALVLMFILGKKLLQPAFRFISGTRQLELFTLTVLLVVIAAAWLFHLLGLTYALGAFFAGVMLSETEFKHQIEVEIRPFRDVLLALFFVSIGMLLNIKIWPEVWIWITLLSIALVIGKGLLVFILCRIMDNNSIAAFRTSLSLAQGGEFGFVILSLALAKGLIPSEYSQVILAALGISIAIAPMLIRYNFQIGTIFFKHTFKKELESTIKSTELTTQKLSNHIIICGYGRVGQQIARILEQEKIEFIGVDLDYEIVKNAVLVGNRINFGDASHPGILQALGIERAKILVISFLNLPAAIRIIDTVRQRNSKIKILVRCRDQAEFDQLKERGATKIVVELFEESLTLAHHLLQLVHTPAAKIAHLIEHARKHDYALLREIFLDEQEEEFEYSGYDQLIPVIIPANAFAVNKALREFNFHEIKVEVVAIRRGETKHNKPHANIKLAVGDIMVLYGEKSQLEIAEKKLLKGV